MMAMAREMRPAMRPTTTTLMARRMAGEVKVRGFRRKVSRSRCRSSSAFCSSGLAKISGRKRTEEEAEEEEAEEDKEEVEEEGVEVLGPSSG